MLDLLLLPWTVFKYVFSLGLWVLFFLTLDFYCKKYDVYSKVWSFVTGISSKLFRKNQKKFSDGQDDYYNSL